MPGALAPYACDGTRGRVHAEAEHPLRSPFQRDRDRILHCAAFRRLEYKTQVFLNSAGDHYRTRLTHTLEVAQISRTLACALGLNEDLAEAVALAHDVGHTPFGHAGERELGRLLAEDGGFEHNRHGLRVVDILERRYAAFEGLNLTFEVREAFLRHHGTYDAPGGMPAEFALAGPGAPLEIEATLLADEIAYNSHDMDDGLSSGLLREKDVADQPLWRRALAGARGRDKTWPPSLRRAEGVRRLINLLVTDVVRTARRRLAKAGLRSIEDVRRRKGGPIFGFSPAIRKDKGEWERFLFSALYRHPRVLKAMDEACRMLRVLFNGYVARPSRLPLEYRQRRAESPDAGRRRLAADYVAGMTDRFAIGEYARMSK